MGELRFYEKVEKKIGNVFASLGRFVSRHPWKVFIIAVLINLALGVGMIRLELVTDAERVYTPQGSQARQDEEKIKTIFPDLSRTNFRKQQIITVPTWTAVLIKSRGGNILEGGDLEEILALDEQIQNITAVKEDGTEIRLPDVCAMANGECAVQGSVFLTPEFREANRRQDIPYPWFTSSQGLTNYKTRIGGYVKHNETHLQGMEYIKLEYNLRTDVDNLDDVLKWCDTFLVIMKGYSSDLIKVDYAHYDSLDEELHENVIGDIGLYAVTVAIMMCYSLMATISARVTDSVGQRIMLGLAGWTATGLAILSAVGLCTAVGVEYVSIVGVSPFLVSGIGIDDMFILLSGLSGAQAQPTISDKMAATFRSSGVGISITTLTDLLAFGCGATSSFISVRNFCIYTGVAVTFCYFNHLAITGACMVLNERRVADNKHWLTCKRIQTKEEAEGQGHKKSYLLCCTGRPPTSRDESESFLDKFPRWLIPKIVLRTPFKVIICFLFAGYMAGAVYGCINLIQGLRFSELPSDTSYYYGYAVTEEKYFPRQSPVPFIIDQPHDYSRQGIQDKITTFMSKVKNDSYFEDDFEINWLDTYRRTPFYNDTNEVAFIGGLEAFLNTPMFAMFENDVVINPSKTRITSMRIYTRSRNLEGSQEEGDLMLRARELADEFDLGCFAYYPSFILFEQYVLILPQTLLTVGIALVVVIVVTSFFMPHPVLILFCTSAVGMIMAGVIGYMYYIDVALSGITMVQIIMGIGFSVDFTAHICHGYMSSTGKTRDLRVIGAIDETGSPITHGAISSLLGIAMLGAAKSYVFRTFAAVVSFILGFGWAHALILLPVVLSWIGPGSNESDKTTKERPSSSSFYRNVYIPKHAYANGGYTNGVIGGTSLSRGQSSTMSNGLHVSRLSIVNNEKDMYKFEENASVYKLYPDRRLRGSFRWESSSTLSGDLVREPHGVRATM